jgi:hypothetical protein
MKEITIHVRYSETNEGYLYDIYPCSPIEVEHEDESVEGGLCTGSIVDAVGMAQEYLKISQPEEEISVASPIQIEAMKKPCPSCDMGSLHEVPDQEEPYEMYLWCDNCKLSMDSDGGIII